MPSIRETNPPQTGRAPTPDVPAPVERAAAAFFGALSRARGRRIFHPRGDAFEAQLEVDRPLRRYDGVALISERASHRATVRLSRALGLPSPLPDVLGIAVRIEIEPLQDLLLVSSGGPPVLRHLLLPTRGGFAANSYSSVLPYRVADDVLLFGALPAGPLEFDLAVAPLTGAWEPFGRLRLQAAIDHERAEGLRFNPWNTGPGLEPVGPLNGTRRSSYAGSQKGRGAA